MKIKVEVNETDKLHEIILETTEDTAKYVLFGIGQIAKALLTKPNPNSIISNLSASVINTQIKNFFYRWKAEKEIKLPYFYRGQPGEVKLIMKSIVPTEYTVFEGKKEEKEVENDNK
jgi:hypothetical protein